MDNRTKDTTSSLTDVISELLNPPKVVDKSNEIIIAEQSKKIESLTHDSNFVNEANKQFRDLVFQLGGDLEKIEEYLTTALLGRNAWVRREGLMYARSKVSRVTNKLHSLMIVERALKSGEDIHSSPIKTHKLEIVGNEFYQAGQWIVNQERPMKEEARDE
jgi:hypothetical protein